MDKQEALKKLTELTKQIKELVSEAEKLSDENGLDFSLNIAYGMGGTYYGANHPEVEEWIRDELYLEEGEGGWYPSSMSC